jgi:hypothetical protein
MIELHIDNRRMECAPDTSVVLSASLRQITNPESIREQRHEFRLPMTAENRKAMGFPEQTLSTEHFNRTAHSGEVRCKGTTLLKGRVKLVRCETGADGNGVYYIALIVPPPEWIRRAAEQKLSECPVEFDRMVNGETIRQSWTDNSPVKFLPVKRDRYPAPGEETARITTLNWEDYHPFVQAGALLHAIANQAGYRIESQFLNEPFFRSLCVSGNYKEYDREGTDLFMDFRARRTSGSKTTNANNNGTVFTSAKQTSASVGNLVDTPEPYNGNPRDRKAAYYGECFRMIDGRPAFVPVQNAIVGFEFRLKYTSAISLLPDNRSLGGVHRVVWGDEILHAPSMQQNSLTDRKNIPGKSGNYLIVNFNYSGINQIRVFQANGTSRSIGITNAVQRVQIALDYSRVVYEKYENGSFVPLDHWVMYSEAEYNTASSGNLKETVEVTVRSQPRLREKGVPVYLDEVTFEGGVAGLPFTLDAGATVRPLFYSAPEAGAALRFGEVFDRPESQLDFVRGIAHLFGLRFYTDELTKTLYIEPRFTFLDDTHTIDWTEKIDLRQPISLGEPGDDRSRAETHAYPPGDASVDRWENSSRESYTAWTAGVDNRFARQEERRIVNPIFRASFDERGGVIGAPDASLIVAGNRDAMEGELNFPPKIVRYLGMKPLPAGQNWGWPAPGGEYPLAMFHSAGEDGFTLCFDDRGGQLGLKNYLQPVYDAINRGRILTLYLRLTPSDMEAVLHPNSTGRNFRGNFVFRIRGETIRGRWIEVSEYDPGAGGVARCVFAVNL